MTKRKRPRKEAPQESKRPKAYSYLRFSTAEQMKGDSQRRQLEIAEDYAREHGLDLDEQRTYRDLGISAYRGKNVLVGALGAFLDLVKRGEVERGSYLLVENLDRVSREGGWDALPTIQAIVNAGIVLVVLQTRREYSLDYVRSNPMGMIELQMELFRGKSESEAKSRRLKAVWKDKRRTATDKALTARIPGWLVLEDRAKKPPKCFGAIPERKAIVRRIFREFLKGKGQHSIAEDLNREKVEVFGRGKYWHRSYIAKLLSSAAVIGIGDPHEVEHDANGNKSRKPTKAVPGYYPAVIDDDTYQRVQALRQAATPLRGRHATTGIVRNLFGGLTRCPRCRGAMILVNKGEPPKGGRYLVCARAKAGKAGCVYRAVRYEPVEESFLENGAWLLNTVPAGDNGKGIDRELANLEAVLAALPDQIENLVTTIQRDQRRGVSSLALSTRLQDLETELIELREQHGELLQRQAETAGALVAQKVSDLKDALKQKPLDRLQVNSLLRQLLSAVVVNYPQGLLTFQWRHGGESDATYGWPREKGRKKTQKGGKRRVARR